MKNISLLSRALSAAALLNTCVIGFLLFFAEVGPFIAAVFVTQTLLLAYLLIKAHKLRSAQGASAEIKRFHSHEMLHEQKRHYQIALALLEIGEREKAITYIDSVLKEIA